MIINVLERGIIMANPIVTITMENGDVMQLGTGIEIKSIEEMANQM